MKLTFCKFRLGKNRVKEQPQRLTGVVTLVVYDSFRYKENSAGKQSLEQRTAVLRERCCFDHNPRLNK